jgi:hypothetical protein
MQETIPGPIEPTRLYSLQQVCDLIPSCQKGKRLLPTTVVRWIKAGKLKAQRPNGWHYVVTGQALLDFLGLDQHVLPDHRSPAEMKAAAEAAIRQFKLLTGRKMPDAKKGRKRISSP